METIPASGTESKYVPEESRYVRMDEEEAEEGDGLQLFAEGTRHLDSRRVI